MNFNLDAHERLVRLPGRVLVFTLFLLAIVPKIDAADKHTIVVFGDSLVAGYGLGPGEAFPERLASKLSEAGHLVEVINAGVSGDTTTGGLSRLEWSIGPEADAVILELGANDALRGISPKITRNNIDTMLVRLKERNLPVILAGMLAPPNLGAAYGAEFNAIYGDLARAHGALIYPFFLDGVAAVPELNQADGIHPTKEGIEIIVDRFLPIAEKLLKELEQQ